MYGRRATRRCLAHAHGGTKRQFTHVPDLYAMEHFPTDANPGVRFGRPGHCGSHLWLRQPIEGISGHKRRIRKRIATDRLGAKNFQFTANALKWSMDPSTHRLHCHAHERGSMKPRKKTLSRPWTYIAKGSCWALFSSAASKRKKSRWSCMGMDDARRASAPCRETK